MERIDLIRNHPLFKEQFELIQEAEKERIFCSHTMEHFLDVARLMYIFFLEDGISCQKDVLYAAALLHDIGRYEQIQKGTPHHVAGAEISKRILSDCGFNQDEIAGITDAILGHRNENAVGMDRSAGKYGYLREYLHRADKLSRNCFSCAAVKECNWSDDKKNMKIRY